jgi:hypothetical protein
MASGVTAAPERVCAFEPSVWNDFFIQYEPETLEVRLNVYMIYVRVYNLPQSTIAFFTFFLISLSQRKMFYHVSTEVDTFNMATWMAGRDEATKIFRWCHA